MNNDQDNQDSEDDTEEDCKGKRQAEETQVATDSQGSSNDTPMRKKKETTI